jgi:hypothetical protein
MQMCESIIVRKHNLLFMGLGEGKFQIYMTVAEGADPAVESGS